MRSLKPEFAIDPILKKLTLRSMTIALMIEMSNFVRNVFIP